MDQSLGAGHLYLSPRHVLPVDPAEGRVGIPFARWYASNGAQGKKPTNPEVLRAFELFRSAAGASRGARKAHPFIGRYNRSPMAIAEGR